VRESVLLVQVLYEKDRRRLMVSSNLTMTGGKSYHHHRGFQAEIEVLELMSDEELWNDDY
jgi:hypothetical protein